jgi:hypothetical protein
VQEQGELMKTFLEWLSTASPWAYAVFLSAYGGLARYTHALRETGKEFNFIDFAYDTISATFAGLLTYAACNYFGIDGILSYILAAISGHMGVEALEFFKSFYKHTMSRKP